MKNTALAQPQHNPVRSKPGWNQMKTSKYQVTESYTSPYPDSIKFDKGESIVIGRKFQDDPDWKDWYWCQATGGRQAWVPKQFIDIQGEAGSVNTCYDAKELSIQAGELLTVSITVNGFGFARNSRGETGWVPLRNIKLVS
jgi:hypothetical protein